MRTSPSIALHGPEQNTYLVLDDFGGRLGCSRRENRHGQRRPRDADTQGQYSHPVRISAFNTAEGWSRDVTVDIADELRWRYVEFEEVPVSIVDFIDANRR